MKRYMLVGIFTLMMTTEAVLAQGVAPDPAVNSANGPVVTESQTKSQRILDSNGAVIEKTQHVDKSQSLTSGNGELSAHSSVDSREQTSVSTPPVTTTSTRTTTTEDVQH
jgi:hypothetical protein